jgi:hypothetical protein
MNPELFQGNFKRGDVTGGDVRWMVSRRRDITGSARDKLVLYRTVAGHTVSLRGKGQSSASARKNWIKTGFSPRYGRRSTVTMLIWV